MSMLIECDKAGNLITITGHNADDREVTLLKLNRTQAEYKTQSTIIRKKNIIHYLETIFQILLSRLSIGLLLSLIHI